MYFHTKHVAPPPPPLTPLPHHQRGECQECIRKYQQSGCRMRRRRHFVRQGRGGHLCRLSPRANAGHETDGQTDGLSAGALIATCRPRSSPRGGSPVSILSLSHQLILTLHCCRNQLIVVYRLGAHVTSINITSKWSALHTSECFRPLWLCFDPVLTFLNSVNTSNLIFNKYRNC